MHSEILIIPFLLLIINEEIEATGNSRPYKQMNLCGMLFAKANWKDLSELLLKWKWVKLGYDIFLLMEILEY